MKTLHTNLRYGAGKLLVLVMLLALVSSMPVQIANAQAPATTTVTQNNVALSGGFQTGNFPETWDLTKGDLIVSFTYDGNGLVDDFGGATAHAWSEMGIRDKTTTSNFNPNNKGVWLATDYEWSANTFDPDVTPNLDLDDKLMLQKVGGHGEGDYNLPSVPPAPGNNYRIWWDRDGVDPYQNSETANTGGVYNIVMTFHATSSTTGEAYMNINGLNQGFETDGNWNTVELTPAGMTFGGDMTKMQVFYGIYGDGATHSVNFQGISMTGVKAPSNLTVDLSGTWYKDITVQLWSADGATMVWANGNQHGAIRTYSVTPGTYDLKLIQGTQEYLIDDLDCSNDCNAGDVIETLTVDLSGTWFKDITVQLYKNDGGLIWAVGNQHGAVRTYNVLPAIYDLKLVQGLASLDVADIDCSAGACDAGDVTADLKVDLSGTWNKDITVQLFNGGNLIWAVGNQHGAERHYNVLKETYDVTLVQGPQSYSVTGIDCTVDCDAGDVIETLTVDLSGTWYKDITVQLYKDGGGLIWAVGNQHGAVRTYNVLPAVYDLSLVQGPLSLPVSDVNCSGGSCNAGDVISDLKVDLGGTWYKDITVQLYNGGNLIWAVGNQHGAERHYNVLKETYDVTLVQGPQSYSVTGIGCTGEACDAGDVIETLTVDLSGTWYKDITVQLYKNDDGLIWAVGNQHGVNRTYNVLPAVYDLKLVQGPKTLDVANVICTSNSSCNAGDVISTLSINLSGTWSSSITTELHLDDSVAGTVGSLVWAVGNQHGAVRTYNVLKNYYDVALQYSGKTYIWDAVNCTGETCVLDKSTLTVDFPEISGVHTYIYKSNGVAGTVSGTIISSQTYKNNQAVFPNLTNGKYDVKIVKNAKVLIVDDVIVFGLNANAGDIVATLTVKFPGINSVHTYVKVNDGVAGTATGGDVENRTYKNDETTMNVLKNTYDVVVVKGAKTKIIDAVNCTDETCTVEGIVATLTVKFPGISSVHTYVKVDNGVVGTATGGDVENRTYKNDEASMVVLKNTYDVVVVKGAKTKIIDAVDCTGDTCTVDNIVATLTVKFPGISSVHTYVKVDNGVAGTATGGDVENRTYKNDETSMVVLKNTYDVVIVKGAKTKIMDAVDCTGNTCLVDNIVATLTIQFPGMTSVHAYVKVVDNKPGEATGGDVENRTYQNNSTTMVVLKNFYDVLLVKGTDKDVADNVDCTGNTCTIGFVLLKVLDENGNGVPGGKATPAYGGSWGATVPGQTDVNGKLFTEIPPGFTKIKMVVNQGASEQSAAQLLASNYTWTTQILRIWLNDHTGSAIIDGAASLDQGGGFWYNWGILNASPGYRDIQLFPSSYKFKVTYNYTAQELFPVVSTGAGIQNFYFQTGQVFGACITQYSTGAWRTFTNGMELMPGTYTFKNPSQSGIVNAGAVTNLTCP